MQKDIGTEQVRFDLSCFYKNINDPQLDADTLALRKMCSVFLSRYRGKVPSLLHDAIADYAEIAMLINKVSIYVILKNYLDLTDESVKQKKNSTEKIVYELISECKAVLNLGLVEVDENALMKLADEDELIKHHVSLVKAQLRFKPHLLSETAESIFTALVPFRKNLTSEYFEEEAGLAFTIKHLNVAQALSILSTSKDSDEREMVMKAMNEKAFHRLRIPAAGALNITVGWARAEHRFRGFKNPMQSRNLLNYIPDKVVYALHNAVHKKGKELAGRFYSLKRRLLGMETMYWSDKDAPIPFTETDLIPFDEAIKLVTEAYAETSPVLGGLIRRFVAKRWIDATAVQGKRSGAFNISTVLPKFGPVSFTFLNYTGTVKDVRALGHELGHAAHGFLGGEAQGQLMIQPPSSYAEIASIFGEKLVFERLIRKLEDEGNKSAVLGLKIQIIDWTINKVISQIMLSDFERRIHGTDPTFKEWRNPEVVSPEKCDKLWREVRERYYGKDGEIFNYKYSEFWWTYVTKHLHGQIGDYSSPFHVYSYAEGELVVAAIFAQRGKLGEKFSDLYLDALRSGGTRTFMELLAPFGVNPLKKEFWEEGIKESLEKPIQEAEALAEKLKLA